MRYTRAASVVIGAVALATVGCSSSSSESGGGGEGDVNATEKDFSISLSSSSVPAGDVTFAVTNEGPSTHEFVVIKTDEDPASLPVENGTVPEDSLDVVDELEDVAPGTSPTLDVNLEAGSYALICNISGHYQQGMHAGLTVT
jgi:uncharacterized cupredoxin-like copper-binding protein